MYYKKLSEISHPLKQQFKSRKIPQKLIARHLGIPYQKVVHLLNGYLPVTEELEARLTELLRAFGQEGGRQ